MDRTIGQNYITVGGKRKFTDGPPGTCVEEGFLNGIQEEIVGVIEGAGLTPNANDNTQLKQAIAPKVYVEPICITAFSIVSNVDTKILFSNTNLDSSGDWSVANSRFTATKSGIYAISTNLEITPVAAGAGQAICFSKIYRPSATVTGQLRGGINYIAGQSPVWLSMTSLVSFAVGDWLELWININNGGQLEDGPGLLVVDSSRLCIYKIA